MNKLFIPLFIFIFLVGIISAMQPSVNIPTPARGIAIEHPINEPLKMNTFHEFHFHLFNVTDGKPFYSNQTSIVCNFHLYNPMGEHLLEVNNIERNENSWDWEQEVEGGNFSAPGNYAYEIFCNDTEIGGYYEHNFDVTSNGFADTLGFYLVILFILFCAIILGFAIKEEWFVMVGGLGLIILGVYSLNSGIVGFRDQFMTYGISIFEIAIGSILAIGSAIQKVEE